MHWMRNFVAVVAALRPLAVAAIGSDPCVTFEPSSSSFSIVSNGNAASIVTSEDDWPGVHRAVHDFANDIKMVTGSTPSLFNSTSQNNGTNSSSSNVILIGTLGKSSLIDGVVNSTGLDVSSIEGKWETYRTLRVENPFPGVDSAYVIMGSDKRGTIYAIYDHSEQFGVSPWYWWADVPITKHESLYANTSGCAAGPPTVQYRGLFLNDEQPALQNWAMEKFTNGTGSAALNSPFNHLFYAKLFELLLRIKANYLWPAIWGSAFAVDDPTNQFFADYYGIAMGTSHQEPMARSTPNEWNLFGSGPWNYTSNANNVYQYFVEGAERAKPYETVFTLGMRGAGDLPLDETTNIDLLEKVVSDQRQILTNVFNGTDITTVPQIWALYKEVEGYYDDGMRVDDDITLLWADDNWGNIRRFPVESERSRSGGAGVYYHYDYVGDPRDYKWISTTQIPKVWEQMSIAVERNSTRLWIVNVGDLKPFEREIEFFMTYGWNATKWSPNNLDTFVSGWAVREFGMKNDEAATVVDIVANLTRFNARLKPELVNSTAFSLTNYREAENVMADWQNLEDASSKIYDSLSSDVKPAYYQMVHHLVIASSNLNRMYIIAGMNNLHVSQARLSANSLADQVEQMFERDYQLETDYHSLLDGKWDHFMEQTHVGYFYWQQPMTNSMPMVSRVQSKKQALPGPMRIAVEGNAGANPGDNPNNCAQGYSCPPPSVFLDSNGPFGNVYVDVGAGGPIPFTFTASSNASWLKVSPSTGDISPDKTEQRVFLSVEDWDSLPEGASTAMVEFTATADQLAKSQPNTGVNVTVNLKKNSVGGDFHGFVEGGGVVSMEAAHATSNSSANGVTWTEIPGLGRTLSGVTPLPRMGNNDQPFAFGTGPSLSYSFQTFTNAPATKLLFYVSPAFNSYESDRPLAFGVSVDDSQSNGNVTFVPTFAPGGLPDPWKQWVAESIIKVPVTFNATLAPGAHTLKVSMIEPAVVIQKIVVDLGGLATSYLGPPESRLV